MQPGIPPSSALRCTHLDDPDPRRTSGRKHYSTLMESHDTRGRARDDRRHDSYARSELWSEHNSDFGFTDDPWGWVEAREDGDEARVDVSSAHVTAVLVTLDAARWLPSTLEALEHLQDRPHRLIAIDNASSDS